MKLQIQAHIAGLTLISRVDRLRYLYRLPCGHDRALLPVNVRNGQWRCNQCATDPGIVVLVRIVSGSDIYFQIVACKRITALTVPSGADGVRTDFIATVNAGSYEGAKALAELYRVQFSRFAVDAQSAKRLIRWNQRTVYRADVEIYRAFGVTHET